MIALAALASVFVAGMVTTLAAIPPATLGAVVLIGLGATLAVGRAVRLSPLRIHVGLLAKTMVKLAVAHNLSHAKRICQALPRNPILATVMEILTGAVREQLQGDQATVTAWFGRRFTETLARHNANLRRGLVWEVVGAALLLGGLWAIFETAAPHGLLGGVGMGLVITAWNARTVIRLRRQGEVFAQEVVPHLAEAWRGEAEERLAAAAEADEETVRLEDARAGAALRPPPGEDADLAPAAPAAAPPASSMAPAPAVPGAAPAAAPPASSMAPAPAVPGASPYGSAMAPAPGAPLVAPATGGVTSSPGAAAAPLEPCRRCQGTSFLLAEALTLGLGPPAVPLGLDQRVAVCERCGLVDLRVTPQTLATVAGDRRTQRTTVDDG